MMKELDPIALAQVTRRLKSLRKAQPDAKVRSGWIRYMRQALGMTLKQLAERSKLSTPTIAQAERGEAAGRVTLHTLKTMAHAMECELIYAFVPKIAIDDLLEKAALDKATRMLKIADVHMSLEDQQVTHAFKERVQQLATKLLRKGDVW